MKRKHRLTSSLYGLAGELFEVPSGALPGGWSVTVTDGREAYVTGCRAILSYDTEAIKIDAGAVYLHIEGDGLDISRYGDLEITVRGSIVSVSREDKEC